MKLKKWQMIFIVVVVVAIAGAFMGGDSDDNNHESNDTQTVEKEEKKNYKMNETVRVGDVEYVVFKKVVSKTIGNEYVNQKAQDTYLILDISIKNLGNEELSVSDSFFTLLNGEKKYNTDSSGAIYLGDDSIIYNDVNPDVTLKGKIIFDIPENIAKSEENVLQVQTGIWGTETETISLK